MLTAGKYECKAEDFNNKTAFWFVHKDTIDWLMRAVSALGRVHQHGNWTDSSLKSKRLSSSFKKNASKMNGCSCPLAPNLILPVRLCQSAKWGGEAKQRDGGRGARVWKKSKRERERWCVKGLHKSEPKDLIANVRPETQSLFRWYPTVSNTHTCTHAHTSGPSQPWSYKLWVHSSVLLLCLLSSESRSCCCWLLKAACG